MPKFNVTVRIIADYEVEAENEYDAEEKAIDLAHDDYWGTFDVSVDFVEPLDVDEEESEDDTEDDV